MKKLNLYIACLLFSLNFNIAASSPKRSQDPQDYLEGHFIYPRHRRENRNRTQYYQEIIIPLARQEISPLHNCIPLDIFLNHNAKYLKPWNFPVASQRHIDRCYSSELNTRLKEEYTCAQQISIVLAQQYLEDLKFLQFIKHTKEFKSPEVKPRYIFPGLDERPQINPFGAIGPKSKKSPTTIANGRFSPINFQN